MSYGPNTGDIFRRSSSYVDRILKGDRSPRSRSSLIIQGRIVTHTQARRLAQAVTRANWLLRHNRSRPVAFSVYNFTFVRLDLFDFLK